MKALSVKQPFASLILRGEKTIETRTWQTNYRGPLLICASKGVHTGNFLSEHGEIWAQQEVARNPQRYPTGVMLCKVNLIDCRPMLESDAEAAKCNWYPGAYAWMFDKIWPVMPKPVKGKLGLFNVPDTEIEPKVMVIFEYVELTPQRITYETN